MDANGEAENGAIAENSTITENGAIEENSTIAENGTVAENSTIAENGAIPVNGAIVENGAVAENGAVVEDGAVVENDRRPPAIAIAIAENDGRQPPKRPRPIDVPGLEDSLQCPVCLQVPRGDIVQCKEGHKVCKACYTSLTTPKVCPTGRCRFNLPPVRNRSLEEIIRLGWEFPCKNEEHGCKLNAKQEILEEHERNCEFRLVVCPLDDFNDCTDGEGKVPFAKMVKHFQQQHNENEENVLPLLDDINLEFTPEELAHWPPVDGTHWYRAYILTADIDAVIGGEELLAVFQCRIDGHHTFHFDVSMNTSAEVAQKFQYEMDAFDADGKIAQSNASNPIIPADEVEKDWEPWKKYRCPSLHAAYAKTCLEQTDEGKAELRLKLRISLK